MTAPTPSDHWPARTAPVLVLIAAMVAGCGDRSGTVQPTMGHGPTPTSATEQWLGPLPVKVTPPVQATLAAEASGATPTPGARYDGPLVVDSERGLIFTRTAAGTVVLDADDFAVRATSHISGGMAIDPEAGVLYVDQPGRGLHQLDAVTLATRWFLPLTDPTPDPRWSNHQYYPFAASGEKPPLVDAANGRVFVVRGDGLLEIDAAARRVARRLSNLGTTAGIPIAWAVFDPEAQLVHVRAVDPAVSDMGSMGMSWDLVTYDLRHGRTLGTRQIDGYLADMVAWDGNLVVGATPYRGWPDMWRLTRGQEAAAVHSWEAADGRYIRDDRRHKIVVQPAFQPPWLSTGTLFFVDEATLELREWVSVPRDWQLRAIDPATDRVLFSTDGGLVGRSMADLVAPTPLGALPTAAPASTPFGPLAAVHRVAPAADVFVVPARVVGAGPGTCSDDGLDGATVLLRPDDTAWVRIDDPLRCDVETIVPSPDFAQDGIALASWEHGILRTQDGGHSWTPANAGLSTLSNPDIVFSPAFASDATVFASAGGVGYANVGKTGFRSTDAGQSWQPMGPVAGLAVWAPGDGAPWVFGFVSGTDEFTSSRDGGRTWRAGPSLVALPTGPSAGRAVHVLDAGSGRPVLVALRDDGDGPMLGSFGRSAIYRSTDLGETWSVVLDPGGLYDPALIGPVVEGGLRHWLLVGEVWRAQRPTDEGRRPIDVFVSDDDGATWQAAEVHPDAADAALGVSAAGDLIALQSPGRWRRVAMAELKAVSMPTATPTPTATVAPGPTWPR